MKKEAFVNLVVVILDKTIALLKKKPISDILFPCYSARAVARCWFLKPGR